MPVLMKIGLGIGAILLICGSICVTIAALFSPKEYKDEEGTKRSDNVWDESIEDR